jgi:hypothetical protein
VLSEVLSEGGNPVDGLRRTRMLLHMSTSCIFRAVLSLFFCLSWAGLSDAALPLENFENTDGSIEFSAGPEFPGAAGRFERTPAAAHTGGFGGRVHFDFSQGGRYVAILIRPSHAPEQIAEAANALAFQVRRPRGHELALRYADGSGQTFQRAFECPPDVWTRVVVSFEGWTVHWGGSNDGQIRGGPVLLALLIEAGESEAGHVDFDELELVRHTSSTVRVSHTAYQFLQEEGWTLRPHGPPGRSRLDGRILRLDYTQGADGFSLVPPDRSLPGTVEGFTLRLYGSPRQLPVHLAFRTHFMTFHRRFGILEGDGHLELTTAGPPGPGWEWAGGENDGKLHGPLRLGEIRFDRPPESGLVDLELEEVIVLSSCPESKRCLPSAALVDGPDGPAFQFAVHALSDVPLPAMVHWELRNWEGQTLLQGNRELQLLAHAKPVNFQVPISPDLRHPWQFIEAEFRLEVAGQENAPVQAAWVAPLEEAGDATLQPDSPFGMGAYLYRYPANEAGLAEMTRAAAVAQAAGVKWSREEFQWARIEPRRGEYQWEFYDQLLATAKQHGIQVYAIVGYWSGWTKPYTAEGIADYVHFLEALVRRYGPDIRQWEIWNEPNIFFWQGPKDLYAELLKKSYDAVKAIDPQADVLGLSTAGIDFDYIQHMLKLDAPFDILTIHPYRRSLQDQAFLDDLRKVSDLVRRPDGSARPVWLTELGWATYHPHNTLKQDFAPTTLRAQAELIARCYLLSIVSGIEPRTFWYNFRNDGEDPFYFEHQMGIVDWQFRPKPAYRAYAVLARTLAGLRPVGQLPLAEGTMAWSFAEELNPTRPDDPADQSRSLSVLWNPRRDIDVVLPVRSAKVRRVNAMGESIELVSRAGEVVVPLRRGSVVYLFD